VLAGDPERVVDTIRKWREEVGLTTISGTFYFGGMPHDMAMKNIRLFADRCCRSSSSEKKMSHKGSAADAETIKTWNFQSRLSVLNLERPFGLGGMASSA
jgi:hypothetical protein